MLIIEGTDLVGKTTMCKKLVANLNLMHAGCTYSHLGALPNGFDGYWHHRARMATALVQDRFHMSEVAYTYATGRPAVISSGTYRLLDAALVLHGGCVVVVTADEVLLKVRFAETCRFEAYGLDVILRANEAFHEIATKGKLGVYGRMLCDMHIHCTQDSPFPTIEKAVGLWCERHLALMMTHQRSGGAYVEPLC